MAVTSVGVLGAGQMGAGIAQVSACAGYSVTLVDIDIGVVESGMGSIRSSLDKMVSKGRVTDAESKEAIQRIETSLRIQDPVSYTHLRAHET